MTLRRLGSMPSTAGRWRKTTLVWAGVAALGIGIVQVRLGDATAVLAVTVPFGLVVALVGAKRILPAGTFELRGHSPSLIATRGLLGAAFMTREWIPLMLIRNYHFSPFHAGLLLSAGATGWAVGAFLQSRLGTAQRGSHLRLTGIVAGAFTLFLALAGLALFSALHLPIFVLVTAWIAAGMATGCSFACVAVMAFESAVPESHGVFAAGLQLSDAVLTAITLACAGVVFRVLIAGHPTGNVPFTAIFLGGAGLSLLATFCAVRAHRQFPFVRYPT